MCPAAGRHFLRIQPWRVFVKKYLVEFIGTFFLAATIGFVVINPKSAGDMAPLAIGSVLMVMVFAGGHISGAHYNPAVTLAVFLRGKCPLLDVPLYMIAQCVGAVAAALVVRHVKGEGIQAVAATPETVNWLIVEFLYTFALCWVVLNVATAKGTKDNSFYGLAIGFTVLTGAYAVGPVSGGAFNPAVALGVTLMGLLNVADLWIFLVANFAAAVVAALVFKFANGAE
jgi:aquaporin Z